MASAGSSTPSTEAAARAPRSRSSPAGEDRAGADQGRAEQSRRLGQPRVRPVHQRRAGQQLQLDDRDVHLGRQGRAAADDSGLAAVPEADQEARPEHRRARGAGLRPARRLRQPGQRLGHLHAPEPQQTKGFECLAASSYAAKQDRTGDLAMAKALSLVPKASRTSLKQTIEAAKTTPSGRAAVLAAPRRAVDEHPARATGQLTSPAGHKGAVSSTGRAGDS